MNGRDKRKRAAKKHELANVLANPQVAKAAIAALVENVTGSGLTPTGRAPSLPRIQNFPSRGPQLAPGQSLEELCDLYQRFA